MQIVEMLVDDDQRAVAIAPLQDEIIEVRDRKGSVRPVGRIIVHKLEDDTVLTEKMMDKIYEGIIPSSSLPGHYFFELGLTGTVLDQPGPYSGTSTTTPVYGFSERTIEPISG